VNGVSAVTTLTLSCLAAVMQKPVNASSAFITPKESAVNTVNSVSMVMHPAKAVVPVHVTYLEHFVLSIGHVIV
jgi:hypothetical protein